jgi:hypothetical protein
MKFRARVALIGYKFMEKAHCNAYRDADLFFDLPLIPEMKVICERNLSDLAEPQKRFGWQDTETDRTQKFTLIKATDSVHPVADTFCPVDHLIGYGDTLTIIVKELQAIAEKKFLQIFSMALSPNGFLRQ